MKVFVTGADGMLGSSICRELLQQGYAVKAMVIPGRQTNVLNGLSLEIVVGDILDKKFLLEALRDCESIIHVAALTTVWPRRSAKVQAVNVTGTRNVMEAVEELKLKRMVHIGSASSYTHGSKENPGDETSAFTNGRFGMDYIDSKYEAQKMLEERYAKIGFPVITVCPTYMIGPFDSGPSSGRMLIELLMDRLPGYSSGGKNFVCSTDVATAAVNALHMGRLGEAYIAGNENLTYGEFFTKACSVFNKKFGLMKFPHILILLVGLINSVVARLTGKHPKLSYTMARIAGVSQYFSTKKAQQELNMPQTPIEKGIEQCVEWFKSNGYLK
ncbi:MAG: NAD-dependent epimerase/dehydratase family protein [Cyclobacteriaceae bacterium]|nr:NAD-dependent epimerase/dehydratase family protein [Cyclobacteriaceae bacterium]